ncbi:MAG TPA: NADP-dependent oxidoreductase [Actinospica sp.]|jgi:NADPH:quinone reductase-like Zn-dependent oxidoreductase|nr:NADP-dependent oxidoreductase [Actinospica sp.]
MRAITYAAYGDESVLTFDEQQPDPRPGAGELLVRVKAAGVNPVDWKVTAGYLDGALDVRLPVIPGWDVAGVVEAVGAGVREYAPGDEVYAYARLPIVKQGTYAELVVVPESYVAARPRTGSWAQAGGLPLVGLTALWTLDAAQAGEGDTVLVHAAAGGVGSTAVQIAKARGARVIGTASPRNHDYLRELGAEPVAYGDGLAERVRELAPEGVDVAVDYVGGQSELSAGLIKDPSRLVSIADRQAVEFGGKYLFIEPDAKGLAELARLVDAGKLVVSVAHELPLEQAAEAYRISKQGRTRGKIVLVP